MLWVRIMAGRIASLWKFEDVGGACLLAMTHFRISQVCRTQFWRENTTHVVAATIYQSEFGVMGRSHPCMQSNLRPLSRVLKTFF
jgi:hypothetical protein